MAQDTQKLNLKAKIVTAIQGKEQVTQTVEVMGYKISTILRLLTEQGVLWGSDDDEWRLDKEEKLFIRAMDYGYNQNPVGWSRQYLEIFVNGSPISKENKEKSAEYINMKIFND
jgi:hypothetical protein